MTTGPVWADKSAAHFHATFACHNVNNHQLPAIKYYIGPIYPHFCRRFVCHASQSRSVARSAHFVSPMSTTRRPWTCFNISYHNFKFYGISGPRIHSTQWWEATRRYLGCFGSPFVWFLRYPWDFTSTTPTIRSTFHTPCPLGGTPTRPDRAQAQYRPSILFSWRVACMVSSFSLFHFCYSSFPISLAVQWSLFVLFCVGRFTG